MRTSIDPELELFDLWRRGSGRAGRALYKVCRCELLRFFRLKALANDVDDLVQDTWMAATPVVTTCVRTTLRAYLRGVARHVLYNHYRQLRRVGAFDPDVDSLTALVPSVSQQVALKADVRRIERVVQKMPIELQLLYEAYFVDGLSGPEIVEAFAIPEGTVRSRLARVRELLGLSSPEARV
jgi:RNA polymerase sigma factor (sigma-70 family)